MAVTDGSVLNIEFDQFGLKVKRGENKVNKIESYAPGQGFAEVPNWAGIDG